MLTFPRDLVFEAYLGRWVNITALPESRSLRQVEPVTVTWGMPGEQSKALAPPSTVDGVLNNTGGHWTPGNPMSDYLDYLQGRNVPTRFPLRAQRDTFTRTVGAGSWGVLDTGEVWQVGSPTGSDGYSVAAGVGTMTVNAANAYALAITGDSYGDCQVAGSCTVAINDVLGGAIEPVNLVLRYQASGPFNGEHYLLRASVSAAEVLTVAIFHSTLGAISSVVTVPGLVDAVSAKDLRGKFQVEGQSLRGKVYKRGPANDPDQFEPLDWQVGCHHERLSGGFPGWRSGVAAGNSNGKPITFACDDWELRLLRHTGELASLKPTWDTSHRIKKAAIKCADVTQRLGRKERPALSSAPRRYMASNLEFTASDFWPLDEAATAPAQGLNAVPGGATATFQREFDGVQDRGAVKWGETDQVLTSVPGFAALNNGGQLTLATNPATLGSVWSVGWAMRLSSDAGAKVFFHTSTTSHFVFFFYTDGTWELFRNPGSTSLMTGTFALPAGLDGAWVTMALTVFNNGGGTNVGMRVHADGQFIGGSTWSGAAAYSALQSVVLYVPQATTGGQGDGCFSSVYVTNSRIDDLISGTIITKGERAANVTLGWIGERSGLRAFRLTAEEGVPFDYFGDLGLTRPMGPQRPIPLLDQLVECAEANGDFLYAPRYTAGVALRTRRSMVAVAPTATLAYASGHVAPEFGVAADDRPTANLVRAERVNGGFVIVEQTTGPMNTKNPGVEPDAVGRVPADATVNVDSEAQLPNVGGWVRALGTVPELRFPHVVVDLAARELTAGVDPTLIARQVLQLGVGDRLLVAGMAAADVYRDLDQQVRGGREVYTNVRLHKVTFNTVPYEKYRGAVFGNSASRYTTSVPGATTLDAQLTSGTTGARNITTSAGPVWTTAAGAYPLDVIIGGERITISGITGTGAAQVMTISARNVNGLPIAGGKTHPAGTKVYLYQPVYYQ